MDRSDTNVFIVGTKYCGSTLLGTALHQHPEVFHAGELAYLGKFYLGLHGQIPSYHPVCLSCGFAGHPCPTWTPENMRACEAAGVAGVHSFVRSLGKRPIIVDGSKFVTWLKAYLQQAKPKVPPKVILCARNPYAYAVSIKMYEKAPVAVAAAHWRNVYWEALCYCASLNLEHLIVRHEDFMAERPATMRRVSHFLGIDPVPAMETADYPPSCSIGGNPGVPAVGHAEGAARINFYLHDVHRSRQGHGVLDTRWKGALSPSEVQEPLYSSHLAGTASLMGYNLAALVADYSAARKK